MSENSPSPAADHHAPAGCMLIIAGDVRGEMGTFIDFHSRGLPYVRKFVDVMEMIANQILNPKPISELRQFSTDDEFPDLRRALDGDLWVRLQEPLTRQEPVLVLRYLTMIRQLPLPSGGATASQLTCLGSLLALHRHSPEVLHVGMETLLFLAASIGGAEELVQRAPGVAGVIRDLRRTGGPLDPTASSTGLYQKSFIDRIVDADARLNLKAEKLMEHHRDPWEPLRLRYAIALFPEASGGSLSRPASHATAGSSSPGPDTASRGESVAATAGFEAGLQLGQDANAPFVRYIHNAQSVVRVLDRAKASLKGHERIGRDELRGLTFILRYHLSEYDVVERALSLLVAITSVSEDCRRLVVENPTFVLLLPSLLQLYPTLRQALPEAPHVIDVLVRKLSEFSRRFPMLEDTFMEFGAPVNVLEPEEWNSKLITSRLSASAEAAGLPQGDMIYVTRSYCCVGLLSVEWKRVVGFTIHRPWFRKPRVHMMFRAGGQRPVAAGASPTMTEGDAATRVRVFATQHPGVGVASTIATTAPDGAAAAAVLPAAAAAHAKPLRIVFALTKVKLAELLAVLKLRRDLDHLLPSTEHASQ